MALFERRFLTTRVARRLLGLFVLCALLPLSLSSWLSYRHVTRELSNQGEERLRQSAAAAGMSVIERLMAAETELGSLAAADPTPEAPLQTGSARFRLLAGVARGPEGAAPTWGTGQAPAILPVLDEPTRAFLDDGGTHLILDGELRRPVLVRRDPAGSGLLAASVRTDSLWATAQVYSASEVGRALCVLDPYGEPLVCPHGLPASLRSQATDARSEPVRWGRGADERLGWGWQIFLSGQFRAEPWVAIVSEPARAALAPLTGFTRAFVPTLLLALWSVLLLSNVQIRRTIDPLDRLKAGTERIAEGHFESRVVVTSHDEFGELAAAFNGMAQDLGRQFRTLEALHALDRQALESQSLDPVLERIDDPLRHALPGTELGMVLLDDDEGATLLRGTADADRRRALVRLAPGTLHLIHRWGDHHVLEGDERAPLIAIGAVEGHRTRPVHVFPLRARSEAAGFLWIERTDGQLLNETEQTQARQLADQAALSLASVRRLVDLNGLKEGALDALALAIDASSHWTAGHSQRVTDLSVRLAVELQLPATEIERLRAATLLHDIGKIGIPNAVLNKPGRLTDEEFDLIKTHPVVGEAILRPIEAFAFMLPVVRHHHERYDGRGYPDGLAGRAIPFAARIVAVADTFDALVSDRPYRAGKSVEAATRIIEEETGAQFDPRVVGAFMRLYTGDLRDVVASHRETAFPERAVPVPT